uniref:Uncharacterized protein n=1 Tax=Arundo donax TaxID=35708 RepID=A0A0A9D962_ARUDO
MEGGGPCGGGTGQMGASAVAAQGGRGWEGSSRVGATNLGRLRCARQQGKQGVRGVTSWHLRVFAAVVGVMGCLLLAASLAMSALHQVQFRNGAISRNFRGLQELKQNIVRKEQAEQIIHARLLQMATSAVIKCRTALNLNILRSGRSPTNKRGNGSPVLLSIVWMMKSLTRTTTGSYW